MNDDVTYEIIVCYKCGQKLRVPRLSSGKAFRCVKCGNIVRYPVTTTPEGFSSEESGKIEETFSGESIRPAPFQPQEIPQIGKWLIENNIVKSSEVEEALAIQKKEGGYILRILYQNGKIPSEIFFDVVAKRTKAPKLEISRVQPDRKLFELIPKKICYDRFIFPISRLGKTLTLAMACPEDTETQTLVSQITGYSIQPVLAKLHEIDDAIEKYYLELFLSSQPKVFVPEGLQTTTKSLGEPEVRKEEPPPITPTYSTKTSVITFPEEFVEREKKDVVSVIDQLKYLPTSATAQMALGVALEDPLSTLDDILQVFSEEPSLATALLRWANTSIMGLERKVGSIWMAFTLLGINGTQLILEMIKEAEDNEIEYPGLTISGRSKLCAKVAKELATYSKKVHPELAYTAGLIHQIGAVVLYITGQEEYKNIMKETLPEIRIKKEMEYFNVNHTVAASILANKWNFPEIIVKALCYYLEPHKAPSNARDLAHILFISSLAGLYSEDSLKDELFREALRAREKSIKILGLDYREVIMKL